MTTQDYQTLITACDTVLCIPNPSLERVSITELHVRNGHPSALKTYASLFQEKTQQQRYIIRTCVSYLLRWRHRFSGDRELCVSRALPKNIDVLFVSHLINSEHAGEEQDFYYGDLPQEMAARGKQCVIAMLNHLSARSEHSVTAWKDSPVPRAILAKKAYLHSRTIKKRLKKLRQTLMQERKHIAEPLLKKVLHLAVKHACTPTTAFTMSIWGQVAALVQQTQAKNIVVTYEGHAWERIAFAAARSVNPGIQCIGYHHTIMFPMQHAFQRVLGGAYDPAVILTAGKVVCNQLRMREIATAAAIKAYGTHRRSQGVLAQQAKIQGNICLVAPDGELGECLLLFGFACQCAMMLPSVEFVFRTHPLIHFHTVAEANAALRQLPSNVRISQDTVNADIAKSRWVLYRGTSTVIHAALAGLRPIYVEEENGMSIDPLHELNTWRKKVLRPEDCVALLQKDMRRNADLLIQEAREGIAYCDEYFLPCDYDLFHDNIVS